MADTKSDRLLGLIGCVYDAALSAVSWSVFLTDLADYFSGTAAISSQATLGAAVLINSQVGIGEQFAESYERYYSQKRPWAISVNSIGLGDIFDPKRHIGRLAYERCEYVNDWLNPQDLHHLFSVRLRQEGQFSTFLTVSRSRKMGDFAKEELCAAHQLTPHLQRALQVHHHLHTITEERDALDQSLSSIGTAAIFVTMDGRVRFANLAAEQILRCEDTLFVRHGLLQASTPGNTNALHYLIKKAAGAAVGLDENGGGVLALRSACRDLHVLVCPMPRRNSDRLGYSLPTALVLVSDPADDLSLRASDLIPLYGLTGAEAKLAGALCRGMTLDECARDGGISLNTAKTQLRSIFRKTGWRRQSDLTRGVLANGVVRIASTLHA